MKKRLLGRTGLWVSELCCGTATFGGLDQFKISGELTQKDADLVVNTALEAGINCFNTAEMYSRGLAEQYLGKALGAKRKDVIVISKVSPFGTPYENDGGHSRKHLIEACNASLKRLGTDYIDLYELHGYDPFTPQEIVMETLNDLVRWGKVRYFGCSNYSAWALMKCNGIAEKHGWDKFSSLEAMYSLVARELEYELVPACIDQGMAILVYSPLHAGMLSGKYRRGQPWPAGTRLPSATDTDHWAFEPEKLYPIIDELDKIAKEHNASVSQAALNYLLQKPGVCSLIIGTRKIEQLQENLKAMRWQISPEEVSRLDRLSEPKHMYPYELAPAMPPQKD
jgi:aryl-alcohol dehydrogenase-like predicted oxidoreductase